MINKKKICQNRSQIDLGRIESISGEIKASVDCAIDSALLVKCGLLPDKLMRFKVRETSRNGYVRDQWTLYIRLQCKIVRIGHGGAN